MQEVEAPGGFPAASQTANLFLSQPSQTLAPSQSGPLAKPGAQNLASSGVPSSNLFGNLATPASSSASVFGASSGVPSSNPFGKPPSSSAAPAPLFGGLASAGSQPPSSSASPAPLFGGLSPAGSQSLAPFGSAPSTAFGMAGQTAFGANASTASMSASAGTASAPLGFGSVPANRQGSGLFGFGPAQPSRQGSGGSGFGSAPSSGPSAPASSPSDPPEPPNSTAQPLPLGTATTGAGPSQFCMAASLQVPSAFGASQDQPFGKGPLGNTTNDGAAVTEKVSHVIFLLFLRLVSSVRSPLLTISKAIHSTETWLMLMLLLYITAASAASILMTLRLVVTPQMQLHLWRIASAAKHAAAPPGAVAATGCVHLGAH